MSARDELARTLEQIDAPTYEALAANLLAAGYRKPPTIDNDKLLIQDGLLLLDVGGCTCEPYGGSHEPHCGVEYLDDLTKPLERAGYSKPRTVTTVEELDALPVGSVILDPIGLSLHKNEFTGWCASNGAKDITAEMLAYEALPATVLYEPTA